MTSAQDDKSITVIGLGPMGRAMARLLLAGGYRVTVWNRTTSRAGELVAEGATLAPAPTDAVAASRLVILSLTDYAAMDDVLGALPADSGVLAGRVLANLSSDTPARTRVAARWASARGAELLVGGVMAPASMLGTDAAYAYYSGPPAAFREHEPALALLGQARYVGEDPGLAQLLYQAQLDVFLTTLSGLLHAVALVGSAGVEAKAFVPDAVELIRMVPAMIDAGETAAQIDTGSYPGDRATATMMGATAHHILAATEDAGIDLTLPRTIASHYDRAIAGGHGADNWTALIEVIRGTGITTHE